MKRVEDRPWLAAAVLSVTITAAIGFGLGVAMTGSASDAEAAHDQAYETAYEHSLSSTRKIASAHGLRDGESQGRVAGRKTGVVEGFDLGGGVAGLTLAKAQVEAAWSAKLTAEAELAERKANCGTIRRAPDICPTDAELSEYRAALAEAEKPDRPKRPGGGKQEQRSKVYDG